jgi:hypothetical protein
MRTMDPITSYRFATDMQERRIAEVARERLVRTTNDERPVRALGWVGRLRRVVSAGNPA